MDCNSKSRNVTENSCKISVVGNIHTALIGMAFVFPIDLFHKALIKRLGTYLISDLLIGRMLIQADGHEKNIFCVRTK